MIFWKFSIVRDIFFRKFRVWSAWMCETVDKIKFNPFKVKKNQLGPENSKKWTSILVWNILESTAYDEMSQSAQKVACAW